MVLIRQGMADARHGDEMDPTSGHLPVWSNYSSTLYLEASENTGDLHLIFADELV